MASKYEAESDVSLFYLLPDRVMDLKQCIRDREVQSLLDDLIGLLNMYEEKNVECTVFDAKSKQRIDVRILDLLDFAEMIELSRLRYELGVRDSIKKILPEIRMLVRSIVTNEKYRLYLKASKGAVNLAINSPEVSAKTEDLANFFTQKFNPPIVDMEFRITKSLYGDFDFDDPPPVFTDSAFSPEGLGAMLDL